MIKDIDVNHNDISNVIGTVFVEMIKILGLRTAEFHLISSYITDNPNFNPEPFSKLYQRSMYQSMRNNTKRAINLLIKKLDALPADIKSLAQNIIKSEKEILALMKRIVNDEISCLKIRVHNDYTLEQIIFTGKDFIIIDFESDEKMSVGERRLKLSCLKDIASLILSFLYAGYSVYLYYRDILSNNIDEVSLNIWFNYVSAIFLNEYLDAVGNSAILPQNLKQIQTMIKLYALEEAFLNLGNTIKDMPIKDEILIRIIINILNFWDV